MVENRAKLAVAIGAIFALIACGGVSSADKPNIVLLVADDLGYADLSCYGHPTIKTPILDRLAVEGVRFTHHYANGPECTSTRTALLTGRYQQRVPGMECAIGTGNVGRYDDAIAAAEQHQLGLPVSEAVLPSSLKTAGYEAVVFGKWHLGYEDHFNPVKYGWDRFFGCLGGNVDYFTHRELSDLDVTLVNDKPVRRPGYMTDLITDEAVTFLKRPHSKPFFLYVPFTAPHFPYQIPGGEDKVVNAENWTQGTAAEYAAIVEDMDRAIGTILSQLEKQRLSKNTLVIFISDNGGTSLAYHGKYRGLKSGLLEGGIRVPMIVRWPGKIPAGTVSTQTSLTMDITASILHVAAAQPVPGKKLEGIDIIGHVAERKQNVERVLFWRSKRGQKIWRAVRSGDWKYVMVEGIPDSGEWLYQIEKDPGESIDLKSQQQQRDQQLKAEMAAWEKSLPKSKYRD